MDEEITISIGPKERILLDEILKSRVLRISTTEEAFLWMFHLAKMFLVESEKFIESDQSTKDSRPLGKEVSGANTGSPAILEDPYATPGIEPEPAPAPKLDL